MRRLRVGCIGTGFIAGRHLRALSGFAEVEVVAVADAVPERARAAVQQYGGKAYDDGVALLEAEDLDAVWLCVPPFAHGDLEFAAIDRGLPFFAEKPIALDLRTATAIDERVTSSALLTAVGYHWRHLDIVAEAARLLRERPAQLLTGAWLDKAPAAPWWSVRAQSGGQLLEQTTHLFDLARLLVGEVVTVQALERHVERPEGAAADVSTASVVLLTFESGAIGTISSSCVLGGRQEVGVRLVADQLLVELFERSLLDHELRVTSGATGTHVEVSDQDAIEREDREFVDVLLGRAGGVTVPYAEALRTQTLAVAADRSARDGVTVTVDPVAAGA